MKEHLSTVSFEKKITLLKRIHLFTDLNRPALKKIADLLEEMEYQKGHYVFKKGEEGEAVYIISSGKVSVRDDDFIFGYLRDGDVFGEYALIDNKARSASIYAEEQLNLLRLSKKNFTKVLADNREVQLGLLRMFVNRLREQDKMEKQLSQQNNQIRKQKESLEELNEEKNHLMAIIAHDLRNPLASTLSLADLLRSESETFSEDQVICINGIIKALHRMSDMVQRILDVRTIEAKDDKLQLEKIDLSELMNQVYQNFKSKISKKELNPILNLNSIHVEVDKHYLLQILENLVSNAIKFSPPNKSIYLNLWSNQGKAYIGIKDEGPGLSEEDQKKLFQKYQRLSAEPTGGESSTGIGLSIVKKYTELMNGEVWCESELGKGSKFILSFKRIN